MHETSNTHKLHVLIYLPIPPKRFLGNSLELDKFQYCCFNTWLFNTQYCSALTVLTLHSLRPALYIKANRLIDVVL